MQHLLRLAAIPVAAALVLGACGGSDETVSPSSSITTTTVQPDLTDQLFSEVDVDDAAAGAAVSDAPVETDTVSTDPVSSDQADATPSTDVPTSDAPVATTDTADRGGSTVTTPTQTGTTLCTGAGEVADSLLLLDEIEFDPASTDEEVSEALLGVADALDALAASTTGEVAADAALIADGFEAEASGGRFGENLTPEQEDLLSSDAYFDAFDRLDAVAFAECGVELT